MKNLIGIALVSFVIAACAMAPKEGADVREPAQSEELDQQQKNALCYQVSAFPDERLLNRSAWPSQSECVQNGVFFRRGGVYHVKLRDKAVWCQAPVMQDQFGTFAFPKPTCGRYME